MRTWLKAPREILCGYCGETIYEQQPLMEITLEGVKQPRIRCATCVGPAPPDLPDAPAPKQKFTSPLKPLKAVAQAAKEWLPYRET